MIGVTPLPAVTNSSGMLDDVRKHELPGRRREPHQHALARMATRCSDTSPPAIRLTVMAIRPSRRRGTDVSE